MKTLCSANTNTYKYNLINMYGCIVPLKSKLYFYEKEKQ
jgi:hypothetical protein